MESEYAHVEDAWKDAIMSGIVEVRVEGILYVTPHNLLTTVTMTISQKHNLCLLSWQVLGELGAKRQDAFFPLGLGIRTLAELGYDVNSTALWLVDCLFLEF